VGLIFRVIKGKDGMKYWLFLIAVVIVVILSDASWPMENPSIRSPVVSGTVPPSSIHSGLIQSPNPIDTSGNLVITGNVIGGRHFRGLVPYSSTSSFQAPVGSTSLDSFLRYSADLQDVGPYTDGYGPYYSPTGTVTIASPGQPGIFTPVAARNWPGAGLLGSGISADQVAMPGGQAMSELDTSAFGMSLRPLSRTAQELEKAISDELGGVLPPHEALRYLRTERLPPTQSESQQRQDGIGQFQPELKQNLTAEVFYAEGRDTRHVRLPLVHLPSPEESRGTSDERREPRDVPPLVHRPSSVVPAFPQTRPSLQMQSAGRRTSGGAVFPSDRAELDELIRVAEKKVKVTPKQTDKQLNVYEQIKQRVDNLVRQDTDYASEDVQDKFREGTADKRQPDEGPRASTELSRMSSAGIQYKSFSSFSQEKFDWYIEAAQVYLKQGRYYRAADCYSLASVYKPGDPLSYVGKSQALFAAGEYIGSALFLSRALQVLPEYASVKVDFVEILGGQDNLEKRIADAEHRLKISGASELQFLLGYIYYQLSRLDKAKNAIDAAFEKLPDSKAVIAVKKAIDEAVAGSQREIK